MVEGDSSVVALSHLIEGLEHSELRESLVESFNRLARGAGSRVVNLREHLAPSWVALLATRKQGVVVLATAGAGLQFHNDPKLGKLNEALWWAVRTGLVIPSFGGGNDGNRVGQPSSDSSIRHLYLTDRCLSAMKHIDDYPLLPRFVRRVQERCPGLPESVLTYLEDGRACLDATLIRPAGAMIGLAFEAAIEAVLERLSSLALLPKKVPRLASEGSG